MERDGKDERCKWREIFKAVVQTKVRKGWESCGVINRRRKGWVRTWYIWGSSNLKNEEELVVEDEENVEFYNTFECGSSIGSRVQGWKRIWDI